MKELFLVDTGYACYGIETTDRVVTLTAPIAGWMIGMSSKQIAAWIKKRNGTVVKC